MSLAVLIHWTVCFFKEVQMLYDVFELSPLHAPAELKQTQALGDGEDPDDGAL